MILVPLFLTVLLAGPLTVPLKISFVGAIGAHVADIGTTTACIATSQCHEVNPALRWAKDPLALSLTKGLLAGALQLIPYRLATRGHPKLALVFNIAQTAIFTGLAVRNARFSNPR